MLSTCIGYAPTALASSALVGSAWAKEAIPRNATAFDSQGERYNPRRDVVRSRFGDVVRSRFELIIIPLIGAAGDERPAFAMKAAVPALFHRAGHGRRKLLIYVPGGVPGAPLGGLYDYSILAARLAEIGYSLVVPQMSTSQKLVPNPLENCTGDIQLVLAWAKAEGFNHLALAGNGLGAARIAYWADQGGDATVQSVALLSAAESPYLAIERCGSSERRATRDKILQSCRSLIAAGRGQEIVEADLDGRRRVYTAEACMDCFGPPDVSGATIVRFAQKISAPTCVIHGDHDRVAPPDGVSAVMESLAKASERKLSWIAGGDHHLLANPATVEPTSRAICTWLAAT